MANARPVILWFRRDLRLADNDAARAAADSGAPVIPVYVLDRERPRAMGGAHLWWLDKSLRSLAASLSKAGSPLVLREGRYGGDAARPCRGGGRRAAFLLGDCTRRVNARRKTNSPRPPRRRAWS